MRLFSDVGGQLGLWIGLSVATLFEAVEALTTLVFSMFNRVWSRKSKKELVPLTEVVVSSTHPRKVRRSRKSTTINIPRAGLGRSLSRSSLDSVEVEIEDDGSWHWFG